MLFAQLWLLLPVWWLGLRVLGLRRMCRLAARCEAAIPADAERRVAHDVAETVNRAALHSPFPATCLSRSLLTQWMLAWRNVPTELRIGIKVVDGSLLGHAWLELHGQPLLDDIAMTNDFAAFSRPLGSALPDSA